MILNAGFCAEIHTKMSLSDSHSDNAMSFSLQSNHSKITSIYLMRYYVCMITQCHSKLFSPTLCFFSALSKSFSPTLLEYLAFGISAYTYLFSHWFAAPFTPNNLLFWGPTAALQDLKLLGCSSSQLVLNVLHCQHWMTSDSCRKCTAVNHIPLNNEISVGDEIECR